MKGNTSGDGELLEALCQGRKLGVKRHVIENPVEHPEILDAGQEMCARDQRRRCGVVNAGNTPQHGLDFHPFAVDPTHGLLQRNLSMEMLKIPEARMTNATFW